MREVGRSKRLVEGAEQLGQLSRRRFQLHGGLSVVLNAKRLGVGLRRSGLIRFTDAKPFHQRVEGCERRVQGGGHQRSGGEGLAHFVDQRGQLLFLRFKRFQDFLSLGGELSGQLFGDGGEAFDGGRNLRGVRHQLPHGGHLHRVDAQKLRLPPQQ